MEEFRWVRASLSVSASLGWGGAAVHNMLQAPGTSLAVPGSSGLQGKLLLLGRLNEGFMKCNSMLQPLLPITRHGYMLANKQPGSSPKTSTACLEYRCCSCGLCLLASRPAPAQHLRQPSPLSDCGGLHAGRASRECSSPQMSGPEAWTCSRWALKQSSGFCQRHQDAAATSLFFSLVLLSCAAAARPRLWQRQATVAAWHQSWVTLSACPA